MDCAVTAILRRRSMPMMPQVRVRVTLQHPSSLKLK